MSTTPSKFVCLSDPSQNSVRRTPIPSARKFERRDLTSVLGAGLAERLGRLQPLVSNPALGVSAPMKADAPMTLTIRLRIIYATDDKGNTDGQPAPSKETLQPMFVALVEAMRQDWAGTGIEFLFLPDCDFEIRKDSRLNNNFTLPADKLKTFPAASTVYTQAQIDQLVNDSSNTAYRNKVAAERENTLLWLVCEPNALTLDAKTKKWTYLPHVAGSWSGGGVDFVVLNKWDFAQSVQHSKEDASRASHETGHFLHLMHTHRDREGLHDEATASKEPIPADAAGRLARWKKAIAGWIDANIPKNSTPAQALQLFDQDRECGVNDTPADPCGLLAVANLVANGKEDVMGPVSSVTINPANVNGPVVFQPDRNNPMSYFLAEIPGKAMRFSGDQTAVMRGALIDGNRRRLVKAQLGETGEPNIRICAVWSPNTKSQGYSWCFGLDALKTKHAEMKAKNLHLASQCAYVKNGSVLYDAVWDDGARNQHIIWGWLDKDVVAEVAKRAAEGWRVVHIQAYRHPGTGLRYNAIFEPGTGAQQVVINKTQAELDAAWKTFMPAGMRMRHLDAAIDEKGVTRHAAVFVPGSQQQRYIAGWTLSDIHAEYGKEWAAGRKLSSISVVWTADGPRYSAIWNPDSNGQLVMWLHVRERILEVYGEMWCQGYKLRSVHTTVL